MSFLISLLLSKNQPAVFFEHRIQCTGKDALIATREPWNAVPHIARCGKGFGVIVNRTLKSRIVTHIIPKQHAREYRTVDNYCAVPKKCHLDAKSLKGIVIALGRIGGDPPNYFTELHNSSVH